MKKDLQIYDELSDVITALKTPIAINSIVELAGVSTINTTSVTIFDNLSDIVLLTEGMIVTLDDINYSVSNVINTPLVKSFDITAVDLVATEWNVAANFQTGSRQEINEILTSQSGNLNRFPLIWLLPETDLDGNHPVIDFSVSLNLVFAHKANNTDRTGKRIEYNFKPVIQPLQTLFNKWLQSSDFNYMFEFNGYGKPIDSQYSNLPFFGNEAKTEGVITTTDTDAKQINYNLNFKKQYEY